MELRYWIEDAVTNSAGFYDSLRDFSVNPMGVETLLGLRKYLSAREANISLHSIGARNPSRWIESLEYLRHLDNITPYCENFDLDTSKGIDAAVSFMRKSDIARFNIELDAA